MATPYVGEIRLFAGTFAPSGWAFCNGALINISDNDVLFNLIGTTYGGDGQNTFALPDLRGRLPMHQGGGFVMGQSGGVENVTLTRQQMPTHTHLFQGSKNNGSQPGPNSNVLASSTLIRPYAVETADAPMA